MERLLGARPSPPFSAFPVDSPSFSSARPPSNIVNALSAEHYAFVVACVSSDDFVAHATATSNGSKMPRANWHVLEKFPVVIPSGKVAGEFSALFADIIAEQQVLIFQIRNLRRTRDLLLPRLLSGNMRLAQYK